MYKLLRLIIFIIVYVFFVILVFVFFVKILFDLENVKEGVICYLVRYLIFIFEWSCCLLNLVF